MKMSSNLLCRVGSLLNIQFQAYFRPLVFESIKLSAGWQLNFLAWQKFFVCKINCLGTF